MERQAARSDGQAVCGSIEECESRLLAEAGAQARLKKITEELQAELGDAKARSDLRPERLAQRWQQRQQWVLQLERPERLAQRWHERLERPGRPERLAQRWQQRQQWVLQLERPERLAQRWQRRQ